MKLLDSHKFDIIALNETHAMSIPIDLHKHGKLCGYMRIELPARKFNVAGRYVGGTLLFIRKSLNLSCVSKEYFDWGEQVSFLVDSTYSFSCVYRNPCSDFKDILHIFSELFNTTR